MPRRRIGQETLFQDPSKRSSLDEIAGLIDWAPVETALDAVYAAPRGEASWPPLAMFRALLLAVWHDLSDVKLAEALDDRASFRRFCGFARTDPVPERTAFVRLTPVVSVCPNQHIAETIPIHVPGRCHGMAEMGTSLVRLRSPGGRCRWPRRGAEEQVGSAFVVLWIGVFEGSDEHIAVAVTVHIAR